MLYNMIDIDVIEYSGACERRLRGSKNASTVPDLDNANVGTRTLCFD